MVGSSVSRYYEREASSNCKNDYVLNEKTNISELDSSGTTETKVKSIAIKREIGGVNLGKHVNMTLGLQ